MVNDALKSIRASGMDVEFDIDWFIEALDSYYGDRKDEPSEELIIEIISMTGVAGDMINKPN